MCRWARSVGRGAVQVVLQVGPVCRCAGDVSRGACAGLCTGFSCVSLYRRRKSLCCAGRGYRLVQCVVLLGMQVLVLCRTYVQNLMYVDGMQFTAHNSERYPSTLPFH